MVSFSQEMPRINPLLLNDIVESVVTISNGRFRLCLYLKSSIGNRNERKLRGKKKVENKKINLRLCLVPENARKRKLGRKKQLKK